MSFYYRLVVFTYYSKIFMGYTPEFSRHYSRETDQGWAFELDTFGRADDVLRGKVKDKLEILAAENRVVAKSLGKGNFMSQATEDKVLFAIKDVYDQDESYYADDPEKPYMNDLTLVISDLLDGELVEYYTTIDTPIDDKGIDGFIVVDDQIVTLDATTRPAGKGMNRAKFELRQGQEIVDYAERVQPIFGKNEGKIRTVKITDAPPRYLDSLLETAGSIASIFRDKVVEEPDLNSVRSQNKLIQQLRNRARFKS